MGRPSDADYIRKVEQLAHAVCDQASDEGWLAYDDEPADATPLQQSVNALVRNLRSVHHDDDGCLEATGEEVAHRSG